ncbi:MAG: prenyltransferase/squalene oxidase repeat-containing protein [Planctomycetota bacterium]
MLRPLLAAIVALAIATPSWSAPAPAALAPQADDLPDLKGEIDRSIRWLRSTQNPETGSYGGGVEGTAWVLTALARSPRKYERPDGPFISDALRFLLSRQSTDGAIHDEGAKERARVLQTGAAATALAAMVDDTTAPALGNAVKFLAQAGTAEPTLDEIEVPKDEAGARRLAFELLGRRGTEGAYDGPRGRVVETARAILALTAVRSTLAPPAGAAKTATALPRSSPATRIQLDEAVLRGARFLLSAGEGARWGGPGEPDAGLTAMVVGALQAVPKPRPDDVQSAIDDALAWLLTLQKEDGSIHQGRLMNYVTSASIMALSDDPKYADRVAKARTWLIGLQADEGEGYSEGDLYYGGIGYGGDERPDLSNLQMALEALADSGLDSDDPAFQRAIKFLERCQNRSESNDVEVTRKGIVIKSGNDGGAGYAPADSKAGFVVLKDGTKVPRSYGSMSYALLKSFVFAGLKKDDPRVETCWKWLQENYTLDVNPGFDPSGDPSAPYQGLFYYFHTMAKALDVYGTDVVVDGDGVERDWRAELAGRLIALQSKTDGSWINRNAPRWWEGNPVLATSYALLSLEAARGGAMMAGR